MNKLTPLIKGIITGVLMVITILVLYSFDYPADSKLLYIRYVFYAGGILWTLISYSRSESFIGKFSDLFGQGFKCFIVVTFIMVAFTAIFNMLNPQFAEAEAAYNKEYLVKEGNKTPLEIEEIVTKIKKQYTIQRVYFTIFGYLIFGTIITAAGSALLMRRK